MTNSRREFLKSAAGTSLAGIATVAGAAGSTAGPATGAAPARRRKRSVASHEMPRGMTLLSMRSEHGDTLGVKTDRGILDVRRASHALHSRTPPSTLPVTALRTIFRRVIFSSSSTGTSG
jgi:hypothetical protein